MNPAKDICVELADIPPPPAESPVGQDDEFTSRHRIQHQRLSSLKAECRRRLSAHANFLKKLQKHVDQLEFVMHTVPAHSGSSEVDEEICELYEEAIAIDNTLKQASVAQRTYLHELAGEVKKTEDLIRMLKQF